MSKFQKYLDRSFKFFMAILICNFAGILGSLFNSISIQEWYGSLNFPSFAPPNWVFGPVWTILFIMMGIALYLVWNSHKWFGKKEKRNALWFFGVQLVLNVLWSGLFFGIRCPGCALFEIIILWLFIGLTIIKFYKISKPSAYLLIPYWVWVTFATVLNFAFVILN